MEEELKYFKVGNTNTILAIRPEDIETVRHTWDRMGYELTECEKPENAEVRLEELSINPEPLVLHNYAYDSMEPRVRRQYYDGPNCAKCGNRFRRNAWCNSHFRNTGNCYRFNYKP